MHFQEGFNQSYVLYAENCPEEPLIYDNLPITSVVSFKSNEKVKKHTRNLSYQPHILNNHKMAGTHSSFVKLQHNREMASLKQRIRECKSLGQRKKDRNDPILYPSYFIRGNKRSKDARIDGYFKQIFTKKHITPKKSQYKAPQLQIPEGLTFKNSKWPDNLSFQRPLPTLPFKQSGFQEKLQYVKDLPGCNPSEILAYIQRKQMFFKDELMILRARLVHYYGEEQVAALWRSVTRALDSRQ